VAAHGQERRCTGAKSVKSHVRLRRSSMIQDDGIVFGKRASGKAIGAETPSRGV
jgi:hypothetical protein